MPQMPTKQTILAKDGTSIHYQGPPLEAGRLPALIYFALSGSATLLEPPFNQPVTNLQDEPLRIFSWDLPFHTDPFEPQEAMQKWAAEASQGPSFLLEFIERSKSYLDELIEKNIINPHSIGIAGLSRGGFVAAHLAAHDERIKTVLGFAPLTNLNHLTEQKLSLNIFSALSLLSRERLDSLIHKTIRFYIGNHDTRVGTDSCFECIKALADHAYTKGIRSPSVELIIYPSIGHKGHGTPSHVFNEGAQWMKQQLFK